MFFAQNSTAKKQPKTYPQEGKIVASSINQVARTRTYKVITETRVYELDCGIHPELFSSTPGECGGDKKLQIGQTLHFRIEKGKAFIPVPETVEQSGEQGLRILREELKSTAQPGNNAGANQPATPTEIKQ